MIQRPEIGKSLDRHPWTFPRQALVRAHELRDRPRETLAAASIGDLIWERLSPAIERFGPELNGFALPWLFGMSGYLCLERDALFEAGLFEEEAYGWNFEEADLAYRLHRGGLRFHVAEARVFHQLRPLRSWPTPELEAMVRFAKAHGPVHAWLLARFLTHENVLQLAELAASLTGAAPAAERALEAACAELLPSLHHALRDLWGQA
jgi:hypothetical protein